MCDEAPGTTHACPRCAARDRPGAFEDLYDETVPHVHRLALLIRGGDAAAAGELVRETYVEVRRAGASFDPAEHRPLSWVLATTSAVARDGGPPLPDGRVA